MDALEKVRRIIYGQPGDPVTSIQLTKKRTIALAKQLIPEVPVNAVLMLEFGNDATKSNLRKLAAEKHRCGKLSDDEFLDELFKGGRCPTIYGVKILDPRTQV